MVDQENSNLDIHIEQWMFDYYVDKCVSKSTQGQEVDENSRQYLQVLMLHSIDPDYKLNKVKANMLIVMDYQLQLAELDISDFDSENCKKLLQSREETTELFDIVMNGLRDSLLNLKDSKDSLPQNVLNLCQTCLLLLHAYVLQVLHHLKTAPDTNYKASELKNYTSAVIKKAAKDLASVTKKEKAILQACQDLHKANQKVSQREENLPSLEDLISKLSELVQAINSKLPKPEILKIAKSYVKLQAVLAENGNTDLLESEESSTLSLDQCAQRNNSSSGPSDRRRSRKRKNGSESDSEASSASSPERVSRHHPPSKSERPSVPDSRTLESKKPASHARGKKGAWTTAEEEDFVLSVLQIGVGKWAEVKEAIGSLRSSVQLKDKWRNIPKSRVRSIALENELPVP